MTTLSNKHYKRTERHTYAPHTDVPHGGIARFLLHLLPILMLAGLVLLTYFGMWRAYFATLDDFGITGWVRSRSSLWVAIQGYGSGVRFLNYVPIWFKAQSFGLDAAPYLWSGLLQYMAMVWLVYALAHQLFGRRVLSLLSAALFAVAYSHYEVVTYVSASDYTFWAIFYLATVNLFVYYLSSPELAAGKRYAYYVALVVYAILSFGHDFTLNMPLVLLALHLLLYWDLRQCRQSGWAEQVQAIRRLLVAHIPFWCVWGIHIALQLTLVATGTSEAVYSEIGYTPGLHMLGNLRYLIFLLLPNVTIGPIQSFVVTHFSSAVVAGIWQLSMGLGLLLQILFLWYLWRGPRVVRASIALIYLPFLQYTPWQGHFIEAPRYLLLPSVGWALFLSWLIFAFANLQEVTNGSQVDQRNAMSADQSSMGQANRRQQKPSWQRGRVTVTAILLLCFFAANVAVIQIWLQQHIENGYFRRTFVTALNDEYYTVLGPDAHVWIEVPEEKYTDLTDSCRLVFDQYFVRCFTYVAGESTPSDRVDIPSDRKFYWLEATPAGITQHYPFE